MYEMKLKYNLHTNEIVYLSQKYHIQHYHSSVNYSRWYFKTLDVIHIRSREWKSLCECLDTKITSDFSQYIIKLQ
jgi:hypothetical protein